MEADKKQNQFMCRQYNIVGVQINAMLCLLSNKQKKKKKKNILDDLKALKLSLFFLHLKENSSLLCFTCKRLFIHKHLWLKGY